MRSVYAFIAAGAMLGQIGCHSAFINATVSNRTSEPLRLIEVDYPSASFGTESLAPGTDFHYRFKVLGNGPTTVMWTDSSHHDHKKGGPVLHEGDDGSVTIVFHPNQDPAWSLQLTHR